MKRRWETHWSEENYSPPWMVSVIPKELRHAVESGWFTPGSNVLDIGCGSGEFAAWLASRGFRVLGIDLSEAAIERAKSNHSKGNLEFKALNIALEFPGLTRFDAAFDRGCYHMIAKPLRSNYAHNVASSLVAGAPFLLIARAGGKSQQRFIDDAKTVFESAFRLLKIEKTHIDMASGSEPVLGVAFWLIRR